MDENVVLGGMAAIPFIVAIVGGLKSFVPPRTVPFVAMVIGVIWNVGLTVGTDEFSREDIFLGMVIGLAASGLYSAGTSVVDEIQDRRNGGDDPPVGDIT